MATQSSSRFDGIDVLRGISILAVVLLHISLRMRFAGFSFESDLPRWLFHLLFWNGNNGVTVFFSVSGFLITLMSIRRFGSLAQLRIAAFYRLRFARIAPLLLLLLGILSALHLLRVEGFEIARTSLPRALFSALTFQLNWLEAETGYLPASWDVLWSLSIEEVFYLGFPLACGVLLRAKRGIWLFVALLCAFVVAGPFARTSWTTNEIWREKSYLGGMDAIALGCLTALLTDHLLRRGPAVSLRILEAAGFGMILLIAIYPNWFWMRFLGRAGLDGTVLALGTCMVMLQSVLRGSPSGIWSAPIRWLGQHSYEVYLTHEFVVIGVAVFYTHWRTGPLAAWFVATILLSAALGAVAARYFSEPLNRRLRAHAAIDELRGVASNAHVDGAAETPDRAVPDRSAHPE